MDKQTREIPGFSSLQAHSMERRKATDDLKRREIND